MGLFKKRKTGELVTAYQYNGSNGDFIIRMLIEEHHMDKDIADNLVESLHESNMPGLHVVIFPDEYVAIRPDKLFKDEYEAHMIEFHEEDNNE